MDLKEVMILAPASEIENMRPRTNQECADLLGINHYDYVRDYPKLIMHLRLKWAKALYEEYAKIPTAPQTDKYRNG